MIGQQRDNNGYAYVYDANHSLRTFINATMTVNSILMQNDYLF